MRVYTGGSFDLIHPGHVRFLNDCAKLAGADGHVTVSLNTDEFIRSYKGHDPVMSWADRAAVLGALADVDDVIENTGGPDSKPAILRSYPDIIAIGTDWAARDYHAQMGFTAEWLDRLGITLVYLPLLAGHSSTALRERLGP